MDPALLKIRTRADGRLALVIGALIVLVICALPLLWSVGQALAAPATAIQWPLWWSSIGLAALAASIALGVGMLGHAASGNGGWLSAIGVVLALTAACALPSYVHALTWSWILPASVLEQQRIVAAGVLGFSCAPVTYLALLATLRAVPRRLVEAAWLAGLTPLRARLLLAKRLIAPLLAAWLVAFLLSFSDFPVADHFRVSTYATEVFARVAAWMAPAEAGRLALPILITALALIVVLMRLWKRLDMAVTPERTGSESKPTPGERFARAVAAVTFVTLIALVPLVVLIRRVPGLDALGTAFRALLPDLVGTLLLGLFVGLGVALLAAILARARIARAAAWASLAWPASLVCLGAIALASLPGVREARLEWLLLAGVLVARWLVLAYELWWNFWMRIPPQLEEACYLVGMPWWQATARLFWRRGGIALAASVLLVACFAINDLTVFVLLSPPGFSTTTLSIFSAVHYGPNSYLAALCLAQVLWISVIAAGAALLAARAPTHAAA
jgi:ABC-type Fe3+ transport system permease subunit